MAEVCFPVRRTNSGVVHVCKHTLQPICGSVHNFLKSLSSIGQAQIVKRYSNRPQGVMIAVFGMSSTATGIFCSYIFLWVFVYIYLCFPLRGQHTVLCHPRWKPTSGMTEFSVCWGGAGFEPRTTDLQSGALPLSHLSSLIEPPLLLKLSHLSSLLSHLSSLN
jgi:hypothetical protein